MADFVFDMDDTLIRNAYLYRFAELDFLHFLKNGLFSGEPSFSEGVEIVSKRMTYDHRNLGHVYHSSRYTEDLGRSDVKAVLYKLSRLSVDNTEVFRERCGNAYSVERFPVSMVQTYEHFCGIMGYSPTDADRSEVYNIGKMAFAIEPNMVSGAEGVLNHLVRSNDSLYLFTKGDTELQKRKIEVNRLDRWFTPERTFVVADKSAENLGAIVEGLDKKSTYVIGNSYSSDIKPALELGLNAIYIPAETWPFEESKDDLSGVILMENIKAFVPLYENIVGRKAC